MSRLCKHVGNLVNQIAGCALILIKSSRKLPDRWYYIDASKKCE